MKPTPQTRFEKKNPAMMQTMPTPIKVPRVLELAVSSLQLAPSPTS